MGAQSREYAIATFSANLLVCTYYDQLKIQKWLQFVIVIINEDFMQPFPILQNQLEEMSALLGAEVVNTFSEEGIRI